MKNILLVEDDAPLGRGVSLALKAPELSITLCAALAEARQALRVHPFDLLILDVNLPDGSGLQLLEEVRRTSAVPVLLLTANDMESDQVAGLELGADDYVTKPFSLAVLRARVNSLLRRGAPASAQGCWSFRPFPLTLRPWSLPETERPSSYPKPSSACFACWSSAGGRR